MTTKTLVSLTSTKRSRTVTALIFALFIVLCISRLNAPSAFLFGRPRSAPPQKPLGSVYNGPRFEIFGIPDFADSIEVATLNIKVKEDKPKTKQDPSKFPITPPASGKPTFPQPPTRPDDTVTRLDDKAPKPSDALNTRDEHQSFQHLSTLQQQLPIALPHFHPHRLDDPHFNVADIEHPPPGVPPATISLDLPSKPSLKQADASGLLFGVATTLDRMPDTLRNFRLWAANTGARFVVVHEPHNNTLRPGEPTADEVVALYRAAGIEHLTMVEQVAGWGERFVALLAEMHRVMTDKTKWAVLMDDDTFFFDLDVVNARLNKYDHRREWYVGALSENKWNLNNGGLFAVGGAGVFLSRALLDAMAPHAGTCFPKGEATQLGGDMLVGECVHRWTTTKLTLEHGLHQLDLHGDTSGFYEAVREQPVSVHHWKSWHHVDMPTVGAVARKCGRACVLQNFRFQDGWQMSNGFSIVRYAYNGTYLASQHPLAMERTWENTIWDVEDSWKYSLEPLKERDEGKEQFLNEKTDVAEDGTVTLYYVRRVDGVGRALIRVVWR
ncbi:unnamed protein product [Discula destructiva]